MLPFPSKGTGCFRGLSSLCIWQFLPTSLAFYSIMSAIIIAWAIIVFWKLKKSGTTKLIRCQGRKKNVHSSWGKEKSIRKSWTWDMGRILFAVLALPQSHEILGKSPPPSSLQFPYFLQREAKRQKISKGPGELPPWKKVLN